VTKSVPIILTIAQLEIRTKAIDSKRMVAYGIGVSGCLQSRLVNRRGWKGY